MVVVAEVQFTDGGAGQGLSTDLYDRGELEENPTVKASALFRASRNSKGVNDHAI